MRILFCNYEYPPLGGGGGFVNALLAEELARRHSVTVLTSKGLQLPEESLENGVRVVRVPVLARTRLATASMLSLLSYPFAAAGRGRGLVRRTGPYDVINTHFVIPSGPAGDYLAHAAGVPNVLSLHGGDLYDPSKWTSPHRHALLREVVRRLVRRADHVVGQSRNTIANLRRFYARGAHVSRIPLGIRRPQVEKAARATYGLRRSDVVLVTTGRLVARKRVDQLIRLMAALQMEPVCLFVIGTGPLERALHVRAQQAGVGDRVRFPGHIPEHEKFAILAMSDIFVTTSQHEGFGLVFLEAMACGLPIVCYDHGGQTDFLENERTGYLVPLNDLEAFRDHCRVLSRDGERRRRMGLYNARKVEGLYIDRCAARYEELFERVIGDHHRRRP